MRESRAPMRTKMASAGDSTNRSAGTQAPTYAGEMARYVTCHKLYDGVHEFQMEDSSSRSAGTQAPNYAGGGHRVINHGAGKGTRRLVRGQEEPGESSTMLFRTHTLQSKKRA